MECLVEIGGECKLWKTPGDSVFGGATHKPGDDTGINQYYDPYIPPEDDDPYSDQPLPPEEEETYPDLPSVGGQSFTIFNAAYSGGLGTVKLASYPYQRTENGLPLFSYVMEVTGSGTNFIVSDNAGSATISFGEIITGRFCSKLFFGGSQISVDVWGGSTGGISKSGSGFNRNVTFYQHRIIGVNV